MPNNTGWTPDGPEEEGLSEANLEQLRSIYQEMKQQGLTGNDEDAKRLEVGPLASSVSHMLPCMHKCMRPHLCLQGLMQQLDVELAKQKRSAPGDGVEITPDAGSGPLQCCL